MSSNPVTGLSTRQEQELLKEELRQRLTDVAEKRGVPNVAIAEVLAELSEEMYEIIQENARGG